jgi:RNA polymerase sigma factor (TIGR02999 family)
MGNFQTGGVGRLLTDWRGGRAEALDEMPPEVYHEIRRLTRRQLRRERKEHTLQATALVHEALTRLSDAETGWNDRAHLLGLATREMCRVLVEHGRARGAAKRNADRVRVTLGNAAAVGVSAATVDRDLRHGRAWLERALRDG